MKKRIISTFIIATFVMASSVFAGCGGFPDLTEEEQELVAEYGAGVLTNYYEEQKGIKPMVDSNSQIGVETGNGTAGGSNSQTATMTTTEAVEGTSTAETTSTAGEVTIPPTTGTAGDENYFASDNLNTNSTSTIESILNIKGVEVSILGYSIEDVYPTDAFAFAVNADSGKKLVVVEYDVWNSNDAQATMTLDTSGVVIKAIINKSTEVNSSVTLLSNDIMNMNNSKFAPGEAKVGVIIFQVDESVARGISSVEVTASK